MNNLGAFAVAIATPRLRVACVSIRLRLGPGRAVALAARSGRNAAARAAWADVGRRLRLPLRLRRPALIRGNVGQRKDGPVWFQERRIRGGSPSAPRRQRRGGIELKCCGVRSMRRDGPLCVGMSVFLPVCLSVCLPVCLFVCLPVWLYGCLSVCLPVGWSVCLFVCGSVYLSICLSV